MKKSIAVMNTKGGVGKSTIVLAIAETLSAFHGKNVLVIDSDAQASVSSMLMTVPNLYKLQSEGLTLVDYLVGAVLNGTNPEWTRYVVRDVSDVDDARSVYLIPSDMQLTLFEREVSKEAQHAKLRSIIGELLAQAQKVFDIVLIDCPPGLSVLTESWLREASLHLSPTKPDYVSICGLEVFRRFKALNPEMGFAEHLGVVINMKDRISAADEEYHRWLRENQDNRCFTQALPRSNSMQDAARYQPYQRSYAAKYPGEIGQALRALAIEILDRMAHAQLAAPVPTPGAGSSSSSGSGEMSPAAAAAAVSARQPAA